MKLIKLTSRSKSKVYINVESIEYMYEKDDCTIVGVTDRSFEVKETVEQVVHIVVSRACSSDIVVNG
jgi:uncharacterized protein YlzI (FlbEa/FlbD family)